MIRLLTGDCRDVLATLPDASVQCVVTSPPYYGLRDYGTAQWDGGDANCHHVEGMIRRDADRERPTAGPTRGGSGSAAVAHYRDTCGKCGARRIDRQIGLEQSPEEYLATMVQVFREVRRVMRDDAVAFVNMGDGFRDKQLLMMPARLALALQADGWRLRSDIIWAKPNPMPESTKDRPTNAHEHVFLLTKAARYFYDGDAIREPYNEGSLSRYESPLMGTAPTSRQAGGDVGRREREKGIRDPNPAGRSCRNVWQIATAPFPAAHFATFPPELAERCIRAGTSERGCCAACGKPWVRVTDKTFVPQPDVSLQRGMRLETQHDAANQWPGTPRGSTSATTTGWAPGCQCNAEVAPCVVLDCFSGAGTALLVADRLGRDAIGIDLSHAYVEMARERLQADCPLFADISDAPVPEPPEDERMADLFAEAAE